MSDAIVTRRIWAEAAERTSGPEPATHALRAMRHEEPHLFRGLAAARDGILQFMEESAVVGDAASELRERLNGLIACAYVALKLGHHALWQGTAPDEPLPLVLTRELQEEVLALLRKGRKILAIKRVREATGAGLREAKDAVDRLHDEMP